MVDSVLTTSPSALAATVSAICAHCRRAVPAGLIDASQPEQFCCQGCRTAYAVIHACGLERYYSLLSGAGSDGARAEARGDRRYSRYDDESFHRHFVRPSASSPSGASLLMTELFAENVHCAACLWLLERLPRVVPGVIDARVDFRRRAVRIVWDPSTTRLSRIAAAMHSLGYPPHPIREAGAAATRRAEDRRRLVGIGIAGACAGNVMLLAFALYAGLFDSLDAAYARVFAYLSLAFTLVSLLGPGREFFRGALAAVRTRTLHMDVPIAIGLAAGASWSLYVTIFNPLGWEDARIAGMGGIYFDSLAMLVFALLIGRFIQHRQQRWAADSVELLFSLSPATAHLVDGAVTREVATETLEPGQVVEVLPGECIPADGVVVLGESRVDQAILTGESWPLGVNPGARVAAGCTNLSSTLRLRVEATGEDTRIGRLMALVGECARRRAPIVQLADRLSGWFVVAAMVVAAATAVGWWLIPVESGGGAAAGIRNAVAVLIVACPCGLGLATPLAITIALGRAAHDGLLIKGGDALQTLGRPGLIFLDKTGTLTEGRLAVVEWHGPEALKALVARIERQSTHPIARALAGLAPDAPDEPAPVVVSVPGAGIAGSVDGLHICIGSQAFVQGKGIAIERRLQAIAEDAASRGLSPVFAASDGPDRGGVALAIMGDPLRADAAESVRALVRAGWDVRILSGDHPRTATAIGREIGIAAAAVQGGASPEEKVRIVEGAVRGVPAGPVVMVGDGVNDSAALAAASVGIAVHGGAEASLTAADVVVTRPGLLPVVRLLTGAAQTMRALKMNLGVSLAYNVIAAALCVTGVVTPLLAAVLMLTSSLTVLGLSFRVWRCPDATDGR